MVTQNGIIIANSLNDVSLGNAPYEMIGRKIVIKRISYRFLCSKNNNTNAIPASVETGTGLRVWIILDTQCNGTAATPADVLDDTFIGVLSFNNMANSRRFKILKEWTINFPPTPMAWDATNSVWVTGRYWKIVNWSSRCDIRIDFDEQTGGTRSLNEIRSNNIFVMAAANPPSNSITFWARIRYSDD